MDYLFRDIYGHQYFPNLSVHSFKWCLYYLIHDLCLYLYTSIGFNYYLEIITLKASRKKKKKNRAKKTKKKKKGRKARPRSGRQSEKDSNKRREKRRKRKKKKEKKSY